LRVIGRIAATVLAALALAACGEKEEPTVLDNPDLIVFAAASMTVPLERCAADFPEAGIKLSFAGSDTLAAQIRQGVKPDIFAAANASIPAELFAEGLLGRPTEFATNELVVAVPKGSPVNAVEGLARSDVSIAIGSETAPVGIYARAVIGRLPAKQEDAILANVRSEEPDVSGIIGKLTQGAVDAGFVYVSDVASSAEELRSVALPRELRPDVTYAAGVTAETPEPGAAAAFIGDLLRGGCQEALLDAGFGPAP